jgi:hypothetical protein
VGPRAVLDAVVERKIPSPHQESNPSRNPALYRLSYHGSISGLVPIKYRALGTESRLEIRYLFTFRMSISESRGVAIF